MATAGSIVVDLLARTSSFETDLQRAARTADREAKRIAQSAKQHAQETERAWTISSRNVQAVLGALGAGAIFTRLVQNTRNASDEQAQLAAVLRSTGQAAGWSASQLNDMASTMSRASTASAGEINKAQTTLLAFTGIVGDQFPQALQAAMDMAARTGMTVSAAAETIGRALDIPSQGLTALSRQGFRFTEEQKRLAKQLEDTGRTAEAQAIILDALKESYGGAAEAARHTFGGALAALTNTIDDLLTGSTEAFEPIVGGIEKVNDLLASEHAATALKGISVAALGLAGVITGRLMASLVGSATGFIAATAEAVRYQMALASMAGVSRAAAVGIGGLTAAARAGSLALAVLGGPVGLIATLGLTAAAFFAMGGSATDASTDVDKLSQSLNTLNREQLALRQQQADELFDRVTTEAENAARALAAVERDYEELQKQLGRGVTAEGLANINKTLVELRAELADANQRVDEARDLQERLGDAARVAAGGVTTLNEALSQTNEAGAKYLERLADQSLMAGLKTQRQQLDALVEAGKLLYTPEDLQRAREYADRIDRVNRSMSATKAADPLASFRARLAEAQELTAALKAYGLAVDSMLPSERELLKLQGQMGLAVKDRVGKLSDATLSAQIAITKETAAQEKLAKQLRQTLEMRKEYIDGILDQNAAVYTSITELQDRVATWAMTDDDTARNVEQLTQARVRERIAAEESKLAQQLLNGARAEDIAVTQQALAGLRQQLEYREREAELNETIRRQMEDRRAFERTVSQWADTVRAIDDVFRQGFADMVNAGEGSWKALTKSMATTFKTTVADTLYKAFAQPFVVKVIAQMAGLISGPGVANEVLKQSGLSSDVSSLADSASKLNTIYGTVSQAMTGASVGASAASLGYANAVGALGGDAIGALIAANGGWAGAGAGAAGATAGAAGTAGSVMGALGAAAPWIAGAFALYSMFGDSFKGESRYGGTYQYRPGQGTERPGWAAGDAGPQAMQFADTLLSTTADAIQRAFAAAGSDVLLTALEASFESSEKGRGGTHSGGTLIIDGHEIRFGTSAKGQGHGGTSGTFEEMMQAAEIDTWQSVIQAWQAAISVFPSMMQDMIRGIDADALGLEAAQALAQQFIAVAEQIGALSTALGMLPFVPAIAATFDFAAALAEAAGGAENAAALFTSYYQNYFDEAERIAHLTDRLAGDFGELGMSIPATRAEFRALMDANLALGEAGAQTVASLLGLSEAHAQLITYNDQLAASELERVDRIRQEMLGLEGQLLVLLGDTAELRRRELDALDPSNRAMQEHIWALEAAAALEQQRVALEDRILELTGDVTALRLRELDALDASLHGLQERIWEIEAEQEAEQVRMALMQQRLGLEGELLQLEGNVAELRRRELAVLDPSLHAIQARIWALHDEAEAARAAEEAMRAARQAADAAVDTAMSVLQLSVNAEKSAMQEAFQLQRRGWQTAISAGQTAVRGLESLSSRLGSTLISMRDQVVDPSITRSQAQARISMALAGAQGGVMPDVEDLEDALRIVAEPSEGLYSSFEEYQFEFLKTAADIYRLQSLTDTQLTVEQRALQATQQRLEQAEEYHSAEMSRLDKLVEAGRQQIEYQRGTYLEARDIKLAMGSLLDALAGAEMIPAFASGGLANPGWALVGERGPELVNFSDPGRVYSADQTRAMLAPAPTDFSGYGKEGGMANMLQQLVAENRSLRGELQNLRAEVRAVVSNTAGTHKILRRVSREGDALTVREESAV